MACGLKKGGADLEIEWFAILFAMPGLKSVKPFCRYPPHVGEQIILAFTSG
jgi:hypothetical protein